MAVVGEKQMAIDNLRRCRRWHIGERQHSVNELLLVAWEGPHSTRIDFQVRAVPHPRAPGNDGARRFPKGRGLLVWPRAADGCIARMIREPVRAAPTSPAALLLP
jgi:hypothetical protein